MAKLLASAIFCFAVAASTISCADRTPQARPYTGKIIEVSDSLFTAGVSDTLRLGHLYSGETATRRISILNNSSQTFAIEGYDTSCGCATLHYPSTVVRAGEMLSMDCRMDTTGEYGLKVVLLKLKFAQKATPMRIYIECEVE